VATVNFSVPADVKQAFNETFADENKSAVLTRLMRQAIEERQRAQRRAAAIDAPRNSSGFLAEVTRCVAGRGRVVAPAPSPMPAGVRLVARDTLEWVVEVEAAHPVIPLRRAPR